MEAKEDKSSRVPLLSGIAKSLDLQIVEPMSKSGGKGEIVIPQQVSCTRVSYGMLSWSCESESETQRRRRL